MHAKPDIICISTSNWEQPWGSRQQIMSRLSRRERILFVEYQMSFLHLLKFPKLLLRLFTPRIRYINTNLMLYRPWINLPFGHYNETINCLNQKLLLLQIKRLIKKLGFSKIILWTFEPTAHFIVGKLKEQISIYHCIDSFKNEKSFNLRRKCIEEQEEKLCRKCNIVLTSTDTSLREKKKLNKEVYVIPSAVNESFFNIDNSPLYASSLQNLEAISKPRIGFVGTIDNRIDCELIEFISQQRPDWSIVLVGLVKERISLRYLSRSKNIYLVGWIAHEQLPAYLTSFDVGIIPYKVNEFTKGISPIKAFEYLAFGKPIVTTNLPALTAMGNGNLIKIAVNKQKFVDAIKDCLTSDNPALPNQRIEFAKMNTWQNRVEKISEILNSYLDKQKTN